MLYLAAAFTIIWLVVFIFVFLMYRRQTHIDAELEMLEETAQRLERKLDAPVTPGA